MLGILFFLLRLQYFPEYSCMTNNLNPSLHFASNGRFNQIIVRHPGTREPLEEIRGSHSPWISGRIRTQTLFFIWTRWWSKTLVCYIPPRKQHTFTFWDGPIGTGFQCSIFYLIIFLTFQKTTGWLLPVQPSSVCSRRWEGRTEPTGSTAFFVAGMFLPFVDLAYRTVVFVALAVPPFVGRCAWACLNKRLLAWFHLLLLWEGKSILLFCSCVGCWPLQRHPLLSFSCWFLLSIFDTSCPLSARV